MMMEYLVMQKIHRQSLRVKEDLCLLWLMGPDVIDEGNVGPADNRWEGFDGEDGWVVCKIVHSFCCYCLASMYSQGVTENSSFPLL